MVDTKTTDLLIELDGELIEIPIDKRITISFISKAGERAFVMSVASNFIDMIEAQLESDRLSSDALSIQLKKD